MVDFTKMHGKRAFGPEKQEANPPTFRRRRYHQEDWEVLERQMANAISVEDLSEDQSRVFDAVLTWYDAHQAGAGLLTLGGYAGTGKSTLTAIIAKAIVERYTTPKETIHIAFCAYTGKAANVLRQKLTTAGIEADGMGYPH